MAEDYIKKIVVGTAQLGLSYGIANKTGKVNFQTAKEIFLNSKANRVFHVDTAKLYDDSEKIIGDVLPDGNWKIITKTPVFNQSYIGANEVEILSSSLNDSLMRLNLKTIEGLMIHNCEDLFKSGGWKLFKEMQNLKKQGLVRKIGVSVYNEKNIRSVLEKFEIDIIQLPVNIFDQRLIHSGCLTFLKNKGVEVYARSIFLQGLLLMRTGEIPIYFEPIKEKIERFIKTSSDLSVNRLTLALGFVLNIKEIDHVVVGVDDLSHFNEIIDSLSAIPKIDINNYDYLSINDPMFVDPSEWKF